MPSEPDDFDSTSDGHLDGILLSVKDAKTGEVIAEDHLVLDAYAVVLHGKAFQADTFKSEKTGAHIVVIGWQHDEDEDGDGEDDPASQQIRELLLAGEIPI